MSDETTNIALNLSMALIKKAIEKLHFMDTFFHEFSFSTYFLDSKSLRVKYFPFICIQCCYQCLSVPLLMMVSTSVMHH